MGKLEKHIGKGEPIEIEGEEFILKPLTTDFIPDFFKAMKAFSGAKEGASTQEMLRNIDEPGLQAIRRIIDATLQKSFPDEPEDVRKEFGMKYMVILLPKIMEINSAPKSQRKDIAALKKAQAIKRMKDEQAAKTQG